MRAKRRMLDKRPAEHWMNPVYGGRYSLIVDCCIARLSY